MSPRKTLRLDEFWPYRLSVLSNTVSRTIADVYEREFGISIPQWRIIAVLGEHPGITAREATVLTAMDKVAVSRALAGLLDKDLVARTASPDDRRQAPVHLTAKGQRIYAAIAPRALAYEASLLQSLSASEREALDRIIAKLFTRARALEGAEGAGSAAK